jgi:hypothetical protein
VSKLAPTVRAKNLRLLARRGFRPAPSLPLARAPSRLRPIVEIAARIFALDAVCAWVMEDSAETPDARIRSYAARNRSTKWMTRDERAIFKLPKARARALHVDTIGWRLENQWALAWVLGFSPAPAVDGKMIPNRVFRSLALEFMPGLTKTVADLVAKAKPRPETEVIALEDLFYCAHNAARSAQLGGRTVPRGFDPVSGGGVIHERRHALTWCLSPGVPWEETDLST